MRILFAGTPQVACPSLRALVDAGHEVVGVITREDAPLGRKRVLTPSPVALLANELGLDIFKVNRPGEEAAAWAFERHADLGVIVAYGGLLREPLLSATSGGWVNLHFSGLPAWRGAAPVQRALMAGETRLGITVFRLVEALDAGDVVARDAREFAPGTSAGEALGVLAEAGTGALLDAVALLEREPDAGEPQLGEASYAHKLVREDGRLDLARPVAEVLARWAGVTPEPGAYVECEGAVLKLHEVRQVEGCGAGAVNGQAAGVVSLVGGRAILALTDGALELVRVGPAGKTAMPAADWLRGRGSRVVLT